MKDLLPCAVVRTCNTVKVSQANVSHNLLSPPDPRIVALQDDLLIRAAAGFRSRVQAFYVKLLRAAVAAGSHSKDGADAALLITLMKSAKVATSCSAEL